METTDRKFARWIEVKIRAEMVEGKYYEKPVGKDKSFRDMMEKLIKEHTPKLSVNTQLSYQISLKHLSPFFW